MIWDKDKIKDLRLRLGFSSSDLARRLHCDSQSVKVWENGDDQPGSQHTQILDLLLKEADLCADEMAHNPLAEEFLATDNLGQIDRTSVKRRFSQNN